MNDGTAHKAKTRSKRSHHKCDLDEGCSGSKKSKSSTSNQELDCAWIKIGSHRFTPKQHVIILTKVIQIVAPSVKDESKMTLLRPNVKNVTEVCVCREMQGALIFIYVTENYAIRIREVLGSTQRSGRSRNSEPANSYRLITLSVSILSDEIVTKLKSFFGSLLTEVGNDLAIELLDGKSKSIRKSNLASNAGSSAMAPKMNSEKPANIKIFLTYPLSKGGLTIYTSDLECLAPEEYLNDAIVDFFLKYTQDQLPSEQKNRTHIFSSFFYPRLVLKRGRRFKDSACLIPIRSHEGYLAVQMWTKNDNIFDNDFIVVPINQHFHWFVAIICFPDMVFERKAEKPKTKGPQPSDIPSVSYDVNTIRRVIYGFNSMPFQADGSKKPVSPQSKRAELKIKQNKRPCILLFNSLPNKNTSKIFQVLRHYLTCEYGTKTRQDNVFTEANMPGVVPKVPMQDNLTDCGLYMLQYVEQFFKDPIKDYNPPIRNLKNWFDQSVVGQKRQHILKVLNNVKQKYNPSS